jgi:hypothetical protein
VSIKKDELKISTEKAFESIFISVSGIQRIAEDPKNRILLENFGVNIHNFTPVIAEEISLEQWIKVLQFYAKECKYYPAKDILKKIKNND